MEEGVRGVGERAADARDRRDGVGARAQVDLLAQKLERDLLLRDRVLRSVARADVQHLGDVQLDGLAGSLGRRLDLALHHHARARRLELVDRVHVRAHHALQVHGARPVVDLQETQRALVRDAAGLDPAADHDGGADERRALLGARVHGGDGDAVVQLAVLVLDGARERRGALGGGLLRVHRRLNGGQLRLELTEVHVREGSHDDRWEAERETCTSPARACVASNGERARAFGA